jgi:hypothetical protein
MSIPPINSDTDQNLGFRRKTDTTVSVERILPGPIRGLLVVDELLGFLNRRFMVL